MNQLTYLQGYPENLLSQVRTLIAEQRLGAVLEKRYPRTHDFATDKALWQYTQDLKNQFLRNAPPLNKVMYDSKIHVLKNALGLHTWYWPNRIVSKEAPLPYKMDWSK